MTAGASRFWSPRNSLQGLTIYTLGDVTAQLLLHQLNGGRVLGVMALGATLYAIEIPNWFAFIDKRVTEQRPVPRALQRTALALAYFNPLWIARHLLFLRLFSGATVGVDLHATSPRAVTDSAASTNRDAWNMPDMNASSTGATRRDPPAEPGPPGPRTRGEGAVTTHRLARHRTPRIGGRLHPRRAAALRYDRARWPPCDVLSPRSPSPSPAPRPRPAPGPSCRCNARSRDFLPRTGAGRS